MHTVKRNPKNCIIYVFISSLSKEIWNGSPGDRQFLANALHRVKNVQMLSKTQILNKRKQQKYLFSLLCKESINYKIE